MTVQHPVARINGYELHIPRLGNSHEHRVSRPPSRFGLAPTFCSRNYELVAMKMDWMMVHTEVDESDADSLPVPHNQRSVGWTGFPFKVSQLNSIFMEFGTLIFGRIAYSCMMIAKSLSTRGL